MGPAEEVSPLTLNRLSFYLRCLRALQESGIKRVSSQELAQRYHLSATQIRKDLAQFGEFGIRGVGYDVDELADHLNSLLGLDRQQIRSTPSRPATAVRSLSCWATRSAGPIR